MKMMMMNNDDDNVDKHEIMKMMMNIIIKR